jgi:predicted lysophospholipase L1 biosynthesis ABC-type transport system permease subunit
MNGRSQSSAILTYFAVIAAALSALALSTTALVKASTGVFETGAPDKTLLELQVESSREIRRALATPVENPAKLPPITARPARDIRAATLTAKPVQTKPSQEAMNAMAMDQSAAYSSSFQSSSQDYPVRDRHTSF